MYRELRRRAWLGLVGVACTVGGEAGSPFDVGLELYRRAAYDSVIALTTSALSVERSPVERARLLTLSGYVFMNRAEYDSAVVLGEQALDLLRPTDATSDRAWALNLLGLVAYYESRFDDGVHFFNEVRSVGNLGQDQGAAEHLTRAAINLGLVYQDLGDFARAREHYLEGISLARQIGSRRLEGIALNNLGMSMVRSGLAHLAVPYFQDARAAYRDIGDPSLETNTLGQLGLALIELGDLERATTVLDSAIQVARAYGLKQEEASNISAKAEAQLRAGDARSALATFAVSDSLNVELELPYERAMDLRSRAVAYRELDELQLASATILHAASLHDSIGAAWDAFGDRLFAVTLALDRGDLDRAEYLIDSLRTLRGTFDARAATVEHGLTLARVLLERGDAPAALRALDDIDGDVGTDLPNWYVRWATIRAQAWTAQGQWDSAVAVAQEAVRTVESVVGSISEGMMRTHAMSQRVEPFVLLTNALLARGDSADAFVTADRARGRHILEHRSRAAAADPTRNDHLALTTRLSLVANEIRQLDCRAGNEWAAWCAALDTSLTRLRHELSGVTSQPTLTPAAIIDRQVPIGFEEMRGVLRSGEVLLQYLVGEDSTIVFKLSPSGLHTYTIPPGAEAVHRQVRVVRDVVRSPGNDRTLQRGVLAGAFQDFLSPVLSNERIETLIVVPHASLSYLPFAALVTERDRHLIEEMNLLIVPSTAALVALRSEPRDEGVDRRVATFSPLEQALPATRMEVDAIDRAVSRVVVTRRRRATKDRFIEALEANAVVHLASHGELRVRNPMASRLEFTGEDEESRFLHLHEVIDLTVNSNLVFLSGCETALGAATASRHATGEDYATLAQAFLYAGAQNVVATLWRIDDRAAADIAGGFYEAYAQHADPVRSLAESQRAMIAREEYSAPYYWAGYQVAGRGGQP